MEEEALSSFISKSINTVKILHSKPDLSEKTEDLAPKCTLSESAHYAE